ncbi:hypothetical protein ACLBSJ_33795, partial [Klebsiella pneumoniae]
MKKIVAMIKQKIKDFNPKLIALDMRITKTIDAIKSLKASALRKDQLLFS